MDSLKYTRELKAMGISVEFEEEHLNSMDPNSEMIFTILSAVAEQESRNISEHTKWGIRSNFKRGVCKGPGTLHLYGYANDKDGKDIIVEGEAETVRQIYKNFLECMTPGEIARNLMLMGIPSKNGSTEWQKGLVECILTNEKYKGDILMQKSFVKDFITHKKVLNKGEMHQYHLENAHPAIVDRETWDAVQEEWERRIAFSAAHGGFVHWGPGDPYGGRVFYKGGCGACLSKFGGSITDPRKAAVTWKCRWYRKAYHPVCNDPKKAEEIKSDLKLSCSAFPVNDKYVKRFFKDAWNTLIDDGLERRRTDWEKKRESDKTTALQKVRARQMLELTEAGADAKIDKDVPEIVKMVLEKIEVSDIHHAVVTFLDGTVIPVALPDEFGFERRRK